MKVNKELLIKNLKEDREWFIKYWAEYVRTHSDKDWSEQQDIILNAAFEK